MTNHASLFTGIGGFDIAAERIGWRNLFQVENDSFCKKTLIKNFPDAKKYEDIREFNGVPYANTIDVISGGFPCQDISTAGKGKGIFGERSGLWSEYFRIAKEIHPKYIVIENSPQLLKRGFEQILCNLSEIGYNAEWGCFCASDFGYSHQRERLFIVANANVQGWKGLLYQLKRSIIKTNSETNPLDTSCSPFLQFEQRFGEPPIFGVVNGLSKRLDAINRLGACGNAIIPKIAYEIFKLIDKELKDVK